MTTYNYFIEMQEMCFRISQACKAMDKRGTYDVYAACQLGFSEMAKDLNCEEASRTITQDQLDTYLCTKNFCEEQTKAAASFIGTKLEELPVIPGKSNMDEVWDEIEKQEKENQENDKKEQVIHY